MKQLRTLTVALATASMLAATACTVKVDKAGNGKDKNVTVATPFGGVQVKQDNTVAADLGLPVYPGAVVNPDKDGDKSADIHIGFGEWQMHIKVVKYRTPDSQDKVIAFYKKAMGRYGDVVECKNHEAVGTPITTREGLGCKDDDNHNQAKVHSDTGHELKAGSKLHQHIMGIEKADDGGTTFALVVLDLPKGMGGGAPKESD